jgi:hypothetical protein
LRKVLRVEGDQKTCLAPIGAEAEGVVTGVGRNAGGRACFHLFRSLSDKVDHPTGYIGANAKTPQDLLVLIQNVFAY